MKAKKYPPNRMTTIGYEGVGFSDFVRTLLDAGIRQVLDVRELPLSRRAGFSKNPLRVGLAEHDIEYIHLRDLGTPKEGRLAARAGRMGEFRKIFADHMKTDRALRELDRAAELIKQQPSSLLCYEKDVRHCHRSIVADALHKITGLPVIHLDVLPI